MKCTPRFLEYTVFHQSQVLEKNSFFLKTRFLEIAVFRKVRSQKKNSFWKKTVFRKHDFCDCGFRKLRLWEITVLGKIRIRKYEVPTMVFGIYGFSEKLGLRKKQFLEENTFWKMRFFWKLRFWEIQLLGKYTDQKI